MRIGQSVLKLKMMLSEYRRANANRDVKFILIGHSLGGVIALEMTRFIGQDPYLPAGSITAVVTIDSPLNHISAQTLRDARRLAGQGARFLSCKSNLFLFGTVAHELGDITNVAKEAAIRMEKESLVIQGRTKGVRFMTVGNQQDCVFALGLCNVSRFPLLGQWQDDTRTMAIQTANSRRLYSLGTAGCNVGRNLANIECIGASHALALKDAGVVSEIATFVVSS